MTYISSKLEHSKSYNFILNRHPFKPRFKDLTPSSTLLQTPNHLNYHTYHIYYLNQTCFSSLKSYLQGASTYQISSFTPKLVQRYATKPERVLRRQQVQLAYVVQIKLALVNYKAHLLTKFSGLEL